MKNLPMTNQQKPDSDTPETDGAWLYASRCQLGAMVVPLEFAASLERQRNAALAREDKLAKALEFYADFSKYPSPLTGGMGKLYMDCGNVARTAIEAHARAKEAR